MARLNQLTIIGRLGKDPDMSFTPTGKAVTKFSVAVDQGKEQEAMWLNIVCWDRLAERMNEYLKKGMQAFVQGRLVVRPYTDKNGVKRQALEVVATDVQVLEKVTKPTTDEPIDVLGDLDSHPF